MPGLIKISDIKYEDNFRRLAFDLKDLLDLISTEGSQLVWNIRGELDILNNKNKMPDGLKSKLRREQNLSIQGINLDWNEMLQFSQAVLQTSSGIFAGHRSSCLLPSQDQISMNLFVQVNNSLYSSCEIVLEAVESSFWVIYARNNLLLEHIAKSFHEVVTIKSW